MAKRRGRPKGSKNRAVKELVVYPVACPKCGGTERKRVPGSPIREAKYAGRLPTGETYISVTWRRYECKCGQLLDVREYETGI